ncbi:MAG TPA: hypothetical protein ENN39_02710 [Desulfonatronum sp.]|nr:hypothetical protein [Desulfonatronum sp.]
MQPPAINTACLFTPDHTGHGERVALACCGGRLAALWDTAECIEIHVWNGSGWSCQGSSILTGLGLHGRVDVLRKMRVRLLICGAMSGCVRNILEANGIMVQPWITGSQDVVLAALGKNRLASLLMPGCGGRGRCRREGQTRGSKNQKMRR